jgi:hypothetical protein
MKRAAFGVQMHSGWGVLVAVSTDPVIRQRELDERASAALGNKAGRMLRAIAGLGREIGPPWTKDHKTAALAAALLSAGCP